MASQKLNNEGIMLFEQPFVRVPYENYRKIFRTSQRYVEKEMGAVQSAANELAQCPADSKEESLKTLDGMIGRVEGLKRKLSDLQETSGAPTVSVMRERLNHLSGVEIFAASSGSEWNRWADTRLDRWLVDWALRNGKEKTARQLASAKGIEKLVDIELFTEIRRIEDALSRHSCTEALAWCSENKAALRKMKSTLEFSLRLQEYIELARARKTQEAIAYAKKHLASWQDTHLAQIRQASALLAFSPTTACGPYKRLYDSARWSSLVRSFRLEAYNLNTLPTEPLLHLALYAGLAALKLPVCYSPTAPASNAPVAHTPSVSSVQEHSDDTKPVSTTMSSRNPDCPVCDTSSLGELAREVPYAHHVNSTLVCGMSGRIMEGGDGAMMMPGSGWVYSREALEEMASKNDGVVTCPRTGVSCEFSALRKVFIS